MWVPTDRNLYKLLTDWGGLIGAVFALIAGVLAYRAGQTQAAATAQASEKSLTAKRGDDALLAAYDFAASVGRFKSAYEDNPGWFNRDQFGDHFTEMHAKFLEVRKFYAVMRRSYFGIDLRELDVFYVLFDKVKDDFLSSLLEPSNKSKFVSPAIDALHMNALKLRDALEDSLKAQ